MTESENVIVTRRTDDAVRAIAVAIALIAVATLIGWVFHVEHLLRWGHTLSMRFNTALCLLVASVALWLVRSGLGPPKHHAIARVCGAFIGTIALLSMAEDIFHVNLRIDPLFCGRTISALQPGRMALLTALSLTLAAVYFVSIRSERRPLVWTAQIATMVASLVAQWSIVDVLLREDSGTGVAPNTACALLLLCLGMFLVPAPSGLLSPLARNTSGGRVLRRLIPAAVIAPIPLGWIRWRLSESGALDSRSGMVLLITCCTAALLAVAIWTANAIDAIDSDRERLRDEMTAFFRVPLDSLLAVIGFDGHFRRISSSWERIIGISEKEIMSRPYLDLVHPDDRPATMACAQSIASGNPATAFENRYRTADGSYRWLSWNVIPTEKQVMYAIAEDITERKRMESELRENAERLRLLFDALREHAVCAMDLEGRVVSWNTGGERLTGYGQEIIGRPISVLYPPEVPAETLSVELASAVAHDVIVQRGWRVRKDGSRFLSEGYVAPIRDDAGNVTRFVKIVHDVTERAAAEDKVRHMNDELEERVKQRTEELASSNRELEAFAYSVSHDLRAPLRHLDGFLALLRRRAYAQLDTSARHYVDATMEASRRMGTLIDELLQFSRLGRADIHRSEVDLNDVINEIRRELLPEMAKRSIRWNLEPLPHVSADRAMLRQVLQNLIDNALKFTRPRTEAVIAVTAEMAPDRSAMITVSDNGVGFDMQYYDKLFGVFQRLHSEDEFEGTGIGLANVRRIVERHGGRVWAESEVEKGAAFHFTLPCIKTNAKRKDHAHTETYSVS
jgi:PAS domain S-box-containing protein